LCPVSTLTKERSMPTRTSNRSGWFSRWTKERWLLLVVALVGASLIAAACSDDDDKNAETASSGETVETLDFNFMAGFRAQANLPFVAVYVADQQGFFDDVGLNVDIKHAALGTSEHIQLVAAGNIDLTTQPASEVIQRRAGAGVPLVAVALFGQRGDLGYAVLADSDIETVADFADRTIGVKGVIQSEFLALLQEAGLGVEDVNLVDVGFNPTVLSEGEVDVYPVFLSNEPDTLERVLNAPTRVFEAADVGVPTLGVSYVVTEDFLANDVNREKLRRFLLATMRGFQFALDNPDAAIEATQAFISDEADLVHERFILDTELGNAVSDQTDTTGLGTFTLGQFQALHDVLLEFGGIEEGIDVAEAIDTSIIESVYASGTLLGG